MGWFACFVSFLMGIIATLFLLSLMIAWYIYTAPKCPKTPLEPPPEYHLPESLENMGMYTDNGDCAAALSLTFQFLFQELKNTQHPLAWLQQKLHQELVEMVTRTTSGKLFDSIVVRNITVGNSAPCIRWAGVQNVRTINEGGLQTIDILLDINYSGGFKLEFDANLLLGKLASFNVEVEELSGRARLRFTREPYTHWSLSFLNPPHLKLAINPFKGRFAALLQAHALRVLRKKHTLPNYTIRYKPFFHKTDPAQFDLPSEDLSMKIQGDLSICILEVARLNVFKSNEKKIYCTMYLDSNPWISHKQEENYSVFALDVIVHKEYNQQLGAVFKQVVESVDNKNKTLVVIETVYPMSAAYRADLRRDDIITAIDGILVNGTNQLSRVIKGIKRPHFTMRIERRSKRNANDVFNIKCDQKKTDPIEGVARKREKSRSFSFKRVSAALESAKNIGLEGSPILQGFHGAESMKKICKSSSNLTNIDNEPSKSIDNDEPELQIPLSFGVRKRRCSVENKTSSDSSNGGTPNISMPGTPSKSKFKKEPDKRKKSSFDDNLTIPDVQTNDETDIDTPLPIYEEKSDRLQLFNTNQIPLAQIIRFNERNTFKLNQNHRYLNLNVWSRAADGEEALLAYLNIPVLSLLKECNRSNMDQHRRKFTLLSPEVILSASKVHPMLMHPGFEPCLCYGDILLTFSWYKDIVKGKEDEHVSHESQPGSEDYFRDYSNDEKPEKQDNDANKSHSFFRTQFHRSTQCDFCKKKIWLKDAVQCRDCSLCCHKKCVAKCMSIENCNPSTQVQDVQAREDESLLKTPDIITITPADDEAPTGRKSPDKDNISQKSDESLLGHATLAGLLGGLRRVGSAHCLSPTSSTAQAAKSLPTRLKTTDDDVWSTIECIVENDIKDINYLMQPLIVARLPDEDLHAKARDYGPRLLANCPNRTEKISALITDVKTSLDRESITMSELQATLNQKITDNEHVKQKTSLEECEARCQILTALMLYFCSALQSTNSTYQE